VNLQDARCNNKDNNTVLENFKKHNESGAQLATLAKASLSQHI